MRVVFALPNVGLSGGIKIILEYAEYLSNRGHDVLCVAPRPRPPTLSDRVRAVVRGDRREPVKPEASHLWAKSVRVNIGSAAGVLKPTDIPRADVVIATWWETVKWLEPLSADQGLKVHFVQDHEVFEGLPLDAVREVYREENHKIVVSRWLADVMRETYAARSVTLVPNGVDFQRFASRVSASRTSDVGFVWSTTPRKNAIMAVEAIKLLKHERPSLTAQVFSTQPCPVELFELDWVTFHKQPAQSEIPSLYADCRVWLFPSLTEGYGLPLLEAMASGTPVVATRAGAAPDLVTDENGVLVDWTPEAMARATGMLLDLPDEGWMAMSRAAQMTAEARDWHASACAFEEDLKKICGCA